jgi:hypothetical protein
MDAQVTSICSIINEQARAGIGPHGSSKLIKKGIGRDADFEITCMSRFYIEDMSFTHEIAKILVQTLKAHLNTFHDHGYTFLFLCTQIVLQCQQQKKSYSTELIQWGIDIVIQYVEEFFEKFHARFSVDSSNARMLIAIVDSILTSNQLINLTSLEKQHLSIQIVKAFLRTIPDQTVNIKLASATNVRFISIVDPESDVTDSNLVDGIILDMSLPKELTHLIGSTELHSVNIVLYDISLQLSSVDKEDESKETPIVYIGSNNNVQTKQTTQRNTIQQFEKLIIEYKRLDVRVVASQKVIDPYFKFLLAENVSFIVMIVLFLKLYSGHHTIREIIT